MNPNFMITALAVGCAISATILYLGYRRATTLTPTQQVFQDAHDLIVRQGFIKGQFTPKNYHGIGKPDLPHCILGAVAACDPDFYTHKVASVYALLSIQFLRKFTLDHLGMFPEDVNDKLGKDATLALLLDARDAS